jgi:polyhydroxybutyrate depolymerase
MARHTKEAVLMAAVLLAIGCGRKLQTEACEERFQEQATATCELDGWDDRPYALVLPDGYDPGQPVPLVVALHGGGGQSDAAIRTSCANGNTNHASCLHNLGRREGFAVAFPNGTPSKLLDGLRTWNAGGGVDQWRCTSGRACDKDVDDRQYIEDLLDDLEARVNVDTSRIYFTGLSNGAAMSYRVACQLSDRVAAIVPVGGAMQWTTNHTCEPSRPIPVMHIHGTADPCWKYEGGVPECIDDQADKEHVSVERTLGEWRDINGCSDRVFQEDVPDEAALDGSQTVRVTYQECDVPLVHMLVDGGGHTWPDGHQYLSRSRIGPVSRDWGSEVIWDFMSRHQL